MTNDLQKAELKQKKSNEKSYYNQEDSVFTRVITRD